MLAAIRRASSRGAYSFRGPVSGVFFRARVARQPTNTNAMRAAAKIANCRSSANLFFRSLLSAEARACDRSLPACRAAAAAPGRHVDCRDCSAGKASPHRTNRQVTVAGASVPATSRSQLQLSRLCRAASRWCDVTVLGLGSRARSSSRITTPGRLSKPPHETVQLRGRTPALGPLIAAFCHSEDFPVHAAIVADSLARLGTAGGPKTIHARPYWRPIAYRR
jgi:hypothetical protein